MADVQFSSRMDGGFCVLSVIGSIDAHSAPLFEKQLKGSLGKSKRIILDMEKLDYIATAGLGVLIASFNEIKGGGGTLVVAGLQDKIKKVFDTMGFSRVLNLASSVEEAKRVLK